MEEEMKINAQISMLFGEDGLTIEIRDDDASITFVNIHMTPSQVTQAFSRLMNTRVEKCEIRGIEHVGKVMEWRDFEFPIAESGYNQRKLLAAEKVKEVCPEGWIPSTYFGSKDSFFQKDGVPYAKTTIRRWVDKENK